MATAITPLANVTLATPASTVTFSSIGGSYRDLYLVITPLVSSIGGNLTFRFNSDSGLNYEAFAIYGNGSSVGWAQINGNSQGYFGTDSGVQSVITAHIMDYATTDRHKAWHTRSGSTDGQIRAWTGRWASTSAITSVQVRNDSQNFGAGATFALYGVSA